MVSSSHGKAVLLEADHALPRYGMGVRGR